MNPRNEKILLVIVVLILTASALLLLRAGGVVREGGENLPPPLELLRSYTPPENEYPAPDLITSALPENFKAGEPSTLNTQYSDGTPVTIKVITYSGENRIMIAQILDVYGEVLLSHTPNLGSYTFEHVKILGHRAVKYTKGEERSGYVWYRGRYSLSVYTQPAGFPPYLMEFAERYMEAYPSTL